MTAHHEKKDITSFLGPFAIVGMVFGAWVSLGFIEFCIPLWAETRIHCEQSGLFYLIVAGGIVMLAGVMAWLTRVIYRPVNLFPAKPSELPSALLASVVIGVVSYGLIRLENYFPNISGQLSGWLGVGLLILGMLLIIVNHFSRGRWEP